jgi:CPA2 family monovalent cation:H+ antiporter-2
MQDLLGTTLILLAGCSLAAVITASLEVPALLGYLAVGALLGPSLAAWIVPGPALSFLSELGVALLLFMVGLEFSLGHFWLTRKNVLVAGMLQMAVVAVPMALILMAWGLPSSAAAMLGAAAAMSSTALVSRQLADQGDLTTRHGRSAIAVLVFQDLASVPLLALVAIWARGDASSLGGVTLEVSGVLLLFAVSALVARRLLHKILGWVARLAHEEAFVLVSLCVVVAAAAAAHALGVSAALGAFLAGMVLGESDFRHHMEEHLKPFRDVLSGLFFVTIGLQLDLAQLLGAPLAVLAWLLALVPIKMGLNFVALRFARLSPLDAWRTGIVLGHGGEFALLLLGMVLQQQLIAADVAQPMLVALVLSMALAPVFIRHHDWLASRFSRSRALAPLPQAEEGEVAARAQALRGHVVVCGAGDLGLVLSQTLEQAGIAHLLLESDDEKAATARAAGAPVVYGDASRPDTLKAAGLSQARLVVVTFPNPQAASRIARAVHLHRPDLPVVVVCWREHEARGLEGLPNVHVYQASVAPALGLAEQVMRLGGVPVDVADGALAPVRQTATV